MAEQIDFSSLLGDVSAKPEKPSLAALKQAFATQFFSAMSEKFTLRVQWFNEFWAYVWKNGHLTPKQAISAMGTRAKMVFTLCAMEAQYLNTIKPDVVSADMPEGVKVTFNDDGSLKTYADAG